MQTLCYIVKYICLTGFVDHRSRNFKAWDEGVWSGGGVNDVPKEDCPHCLNRGGVLAQCGVDGGRSYDVPLNVFGDLLAPQPEATYHRGQEIDLDVVLTAHHKGHFEFYACPIVPGEAPTADCFHSHPLEFVADLLYGAPKDPNYPSRAYIAPSSYSGIVNDNTGVSGILYRFRMKLPDTAVGDLVLIQWHYLTANSCQFPGYNVYNWPADWPVQNQLALCGDLVS